MTTRKSPAVTGYIFRPYITLKDGSILWAKTVGKKAFKIPIAGNDNDE